MQEAVFDLAEEIINTFATEKIPEVIEECEAAFSSDECYSILGDDSPNESANDGILETRRATCDCSTNANYCGKVNRLKCIHYTDFYCTKRNSKPSLVSFSPPYLS